MSKLSKALVPQIGGHSLVPGVSTNGMPAGIQSDGTPTTAALMGLQNTGLEGLAPGKWGIPSGTPDGMRQAMSPDKNYLPHGINEATAAPPPPPPPGYNVWADPDMTKRGWGWGMGADGALHTGVVGGGPNGSPWGPKGSTTAPGGGIGPTLQNRGAPSQSAGMTPSSAMPPAGGMQVPAGMGQQLAQSLRGMASPGQTASGAMGAGMGGVMQLIQQLRAQQQQQPQVQPQASAQPMQPGQPTGQ